LSDFRDKKGVVVVFIGTECPISNGYLPRLGELSKLYPAVQFIGINSNYHDKPGAVAAHAHRYALPFPVLKDEGNGVADLFGAQRTPEACLLDSQRKLRYRGRIDDQIGYFAKRAKPTRADLQEAIEEVLAGKPASVPSTAVSGCMISRAPKPKADATITFTRDVARILQSKCQECHRPGQIGPMPLLSYADASDWSETIREVVREQRMPPWHADPRYGKFSNDRSLRAEDRETILRWIDQGCPKGEERDLPSPRQFAEGWSIGKPDIVFTMKEAFAVPAVGPRNGIEYQNFEVETEFTEDRWVQRAEAKAGATAVVHHIIVFIVRPGLKFDSKRGNAPVLCGTAPGDLPLILPPGTAKKIPKGSKLVFQMHYTPSGIAQEDRSSVGLIFAKEPPEREVRTFPIANLGLRIPPGAANHRVEASSSAFRGGNPQILSFMPHMHTRGKDITGELVHADGKKETLLSIPRYNFNWQSVYRCATPIPIPAGAWLHFVAHFDNSAQNPNNPDPSKEVRWGDQTWEEMLIGWTDVAFDRKK
jgi:hypothetical protein